MFGSSHAADLLGYFDTTARSRGQTYMRQGRVLSIKANEAGNRLTLQASVRGSKSKPYRVVVEAERLLNGGLRVVDADCSCPMGYRCKHAAAVVYETLAKGFNSAQHRMVSEAELAVERWLLSLPANVDLPGFETAPVQERKTIFYLLKPSPNGLRVQLMTTGAGGLAEKVGPYDLGTRKFLYSAEDLGLAQLLGGAYFSSQLMVPLERGGEILEDLLKTGRVYWKKLLSPLRRGEARRAELGWETDADGRQFPKLKVDTAVELLPVEPLWYLDAEAGVCGPLETGVSGTITKHFLKAPAVPAELAAKVDLALRTRFPGAAVPTIKKLEVERIEGLVPVPHLRLLETENPGSFYSLTDQEEIAIARFEFIYGAHVISAMEPGAMISKAMDGKVLEIVRNPAAEERAWAKFKTLGFFKVEQFFDVQGRPNLAGAWTLGLQPEAWYDFSAITVSELEQAGWKITYEDSYQQRLVMGDDYFANATAQGNDWFGVELGVVVEGKNVNLLPLLHGYLARNPNALTAEGLSELTKAEMVALPLDDGRIMAVPSARIRGMVSVLMELFNGEKLDRKGRLKLNKLRAAEIPGLQEGQWRWMGSEELQSLGKKLRNFKGIATVPPSPNLLATLRPYQQEGLNWLQFLREYDLGGALADDMGLGKTVQALAHLLAEKEAGRMDRPSLVVAPTSLMTNWRQEAEKFAPSLRTLVLHGLERKNHFEKIRDHDLIVTSYALLPRDEAVLLQHDFHCVILDEAQYIKNPKTRYAQIASALKGRHRLCLTGTPMENHLGELWSLFNFTLPGFLGDETRFRQAYRNPIEKHNDDARRKVLAHRIAPFILRRRKEEVAADLPAKTEITQNAELEGPQRDLYETIRLAMHARVQAEVRKKGMSRSHIIILDALLKLRQVCCDPRLLPEGLRKETKGSAKLELLMDLVPEMITEGRRILLFSQFTSMLALIEEELKAREIKYVLLTGSTTDRATPIAKFQAGEVPVFLISLKAGGTGLNLTAADTVIHYDPWWNPAVENQATDRAHRIGQTKQVFVYKLIVAGTVEEKIVAMQARKKALVAGLLDDEQAEKLQLTAEDLEVLFAPLSS